MSALGGWMALIMFVAAAGKTATPEQRARLKAEALPIVRDDTLAAGEAARATLQKTAEIMGPDWEIPADYREWIDGFLNDGAGA